MWRATNLLGKQLLLARRLCEAGCGFVTVSDRGWDFHSNRNSPRNLGGLAYLGPQVDHRPPCPVSLHATTGDDPPHAVVQADQSVLGFSEDQDHADCLACRISLRH